MEKVAAGRAGGGAGVTDRNAFVGPRPVPADRRLYGRDRELLALTNRLMSERLILLYSPSGAGKSSLLMAANGLVARMAEEGFTPLPPATSPPIRLAQFADVAAAAGVNRYLLSALIALEAARPAATRRAPAAVAADLRAAGPELKADFLHHYLVDLLRPAPAHPVPPDEADEAAPPAQPFLVFDQFEELLTLDPTDAPAKQAFLRQLGTALKDADRWAVIAMREDHVAKLDPYLPLLPTRLAATFRLDFLGAAAALQAAQLPPKEAAFGVHFDDDAAAALVKELAKINVQDPLTSKSEPKEGQYVEPLYLQVVCERLWAERKPTAGDHITLADVTRLAAAMAPAAGPAGEGAAPVGPFVDAALAAYYVDTIREVAALPAAAGVTERKLREWFDRALISASDLRLPVLLGTEKEYGLTPPTLLALAGRYLIRAEPRLGSVYYELAHDRLVRPVRKCNAAWRATQLTAFQRQADAWDAASRPARLLADGDLLAAGEKEQAAGALSAEDAEFLAVGVAARREQDDRRDRKRQQRVQRQRVVGVLVGLGVVTFGCLLWAARNSELHRRDNAELKTIGALNDAYKNYLQAWPELADNPDASAALAVAALAGFTEYAAERPDETPDLLLRFLLPKALANRGLTTFGRRPTLTFDAAAAAANTESIGHRLPVMDLALAGARDEKLLSRDSRGNVYGWLNDPAGSAAGDKRQRTVSLVSQMAVTPDGQYLLAGHTYGSVCRWEMADWAKEPQYEQHLVAGSDAPVTAVQVAVNKTKRVAVAGYADGWIRVFAWATPGVWAPVAERRSFGGRPVVGLVVSPDGDAVVINDRSDHLMRWNIQWASGWMWLRPEFTEAPFVPLIDKDVNLKEMSQTAVSADQGVFVIGTEKGAVGVYRFRGKETERVVAYREFPPGKASPDKPGEWAIKKLAVSRVMTVNGAECVYLLATTDGGGTTLRRVGLAAKTLGDPVTLIGRQEDSHVQATTMAFSPDGSRLAAGMNDGTTLVWTTAAAKGTEDFDYFLETSPSAVTALLFSKDAKTVYTGQTDGSVRRWDLTRQARSIADVRAELMDGDRPRPSDEVSRVIAEYQRK